MNACKQPLGKKKQIIDAAIAEFQAKGFEAASMDRISQRANVSKRTVYKYFEGKEKLYGSIVALFAESFAEIDDIRYDPARPIREQLIALGKAEGALLMCPKVMAMARMLISETLRDPELAQRVQGKIDKTTVFINMLRAARDDGALRLPNPEDAAQEFLGLIKARAFWPVMFGAPLLERDEMARVVEASVDMVMSRYGP